MIEALSIEITTTCNAHCVMCPQPESARRGQTMALDDALELIREGDEMGVKTILPHHLGEPTLHRNYPEIMLACGASRMRVKGYTNGSQLHRPEIRAAIIDHADEMVISAEGCRIETMAKTRPGISPRNVVAGVEMLCRERRNGTPRVVVRMTELPENADERGGFDAFWRGKGADATVSCPNIYDGTGADVRNCARPFEQIAVLVNGDVILCCRDHGAQNIMGNALREGLRAVWEGEGAERVRDQHRAGEIELCRRCTWAGKRIR